MCYTDSSQEMIDMAKRYELSDWEWERIENLSIDSTSVKAHPQSAGAKKGFKFGI